MRIAKVGVVGAGAMGSGIAALCASAGLPVVLLDIPGSDDRGKPAREGLARAVKAKPAPFMDVARSALIATGNTEDDLTLLADCDWIVEAIIELPKPKQELFAKLEALTKPDCIIASNTSGIPMRVLVEGRSDAFKRRFVGTHFFNPVRYMHLLEVIPTPQTSPECLREMRAFSERVLGKGVVLCKDTPGFIANRLGMAGMVRTIRLMEKLGLTIDEVDTLTGPLVGRPKTASFRTGDLSGLDVTAHVAAGLAQATGEDFTLPDWVHGLVKAGRLGDKAGGGYYRKTPGKGGKPAVETYDWKTGEYKPQQRLETPELAALMKLPLAERFAKLKELPGAHGEFVRTSLVENAVYTMAHTPAIAYDLVSVDRALEWGYGWEAGPYRVMDMLGADWLRFMCVQMNLDEPSILAQVRGSFYKTEKGVEYHLGNDGAYAPVPAVPGALSLAATRRAGGIVEQSKDATLVDLGDGVLCLEFTSKMNTLGEGVLRAIHSALDKVGAGHTGLVLGNEDPRTFTAGANLAGVAGTVAAGKWKELEAGARVFQETAMRLRSSPFPVVAAPFGLTLGGGCEFSMHCDRVQAHAELYMGLVEVGVGILPSGGGTKELLFRFTQEMEKYEDADPFEAVKRAFKLITLAMTSTSAHEARKFGFLREGDRISMNRDTLIADAKARVLDLAADYVAPPPRRIRALGAQAFGNLKYALWSFKEGGLASDHDVFIGTQIAYVLCGGDGPAREVGEQDILELELEGTLRLLGTKETQARVKHMLETGKPLRN
ncbi:MAG: 3-hydroxyacyl-CoA dehydrogenase/enoyl-CoA hydratase family protein [Gemmatimonadetes bacterium]|nr:3-hydroxyacyl-CoA dehydrogenase/enoyl-CoA hydratase family protein [Gemmatimonadota bacterium]